MGRLLHFRQGRPLSFPASLICDGDNYLGGQDPLSMDAVALYIFLAALPAPLYTFDDEDFCNRFDLPHPRATEAREELERAGYIVWAKDSEMLLLRDCKSSKEALEAYRKGEPHWAIASILQYERL